MKYILMLILILISAYFLMAVRADIFLKHKTQCGKSFHIFSDTYQDNSVCIIFENIEKKINYSGDFKVFIVPDYMYFFVSLSSDKAVYVNPFTSNIFIKNSLSNTYDFLNVLHEKIYGSKLIKEYPAFEYFLIDGWKIKGYSRYLFLETERFYPYDICSEEKKKEPDYSEFENRMVVEYLVRMKNYSEKNIISDNLSYSYYLDEAKRYFCR